MAVLLCTGVVEEQAEESVSVETGFGPKSWTLRRSQPGQKGGREGIFRDEVLLRANCRVRPLIPNLAVQCPSPVRFVKCSENVGGEYVLPLGSQKKIVPREVAGTQQLSDIQKWQPHAAHTDRSHRAPAQHVQTALRSPVRWEFFLSSEYRAAVTVTSG